MRMTNLESAIIGAVKNKTSARKLSFEIDEIIEEVYRHGIKRPRTARNTFNAALRVLASKMMYCGVELSRKTELGRGRKSVYEFAHKEQYSHFIKIADKNEWQRKKS